MDSNRADVLIVDDDEDLRTTLAELLRDIGYRVAEAAHGREALEYLDRNPAPKLVLLDLMMPVMAGIEFLDERLGDPNLSSIPVFVITARGNGSTSGFKGVQVETVFRKPFDIAELLSAIERVVGDSPPR
jgi:CheY-like chemotaxis protein